MSTQAGEAIAGTALAALIAPARTALVAIDVQNDFASPHGALARAGMDMAPLAGAQRNLERLLPAARAAGAGVVLARVLTRADTDGKALKRFYRLRGYPDEALAICREGSAGADYYRIAARPGDIQVEKRLYSCFHGTDLEMRLRARGIDTLVLCGFTSECCVESTARSAFERDFGVLVVADASASHDPELHRSALRSLSQHCALLVETEAVLECWGMASPGTT
ncbi:MAG: isochorismatase family cysteine hydrolase [Pseudomonas sp.]